MFNASSKRFATKVPGTIDLEISDPVLMLNEVAKRYETAERVLMEYVDNALDDAEVLFRENGNAYPYPIRIDITINRANRAVIIQDNCRGMTRETLERVVRNIGESQKRGQTWVNGRFGFGVHAFRAAAESVSFQSKHELGSNHTLTLQRDQHRGIKEAKRLDAPFPTESGTGTVVTVAGFEADWFSPVTVDSVRAEIEHHFERLIARRNLQITVHEAGQATQVCTAIDYAAIEGAAIQEQLHLTYKDEEYPVTIYCKIAADASVKRPVSFFARDRRIGDVVEIKSFMRKSVFKTSVWSHPNLMGYIEVGNLVQPIINRDDFVRTYSRTLLYEALLPVEAEIKQQLQGVNQQQKEQTFDQFEQVVQRALAEVVTDSGLAVVLVADGEGRRVLVENGRLAINTAHPDFQERLRTTRQGNPRPSDRLNAYLAGILSIYGVHRLPGRNENLSADTQLDMQIEMMLALETQLRHLQNKSFKD
ncbi:MAG: ATP-binding protein [Anaerolineae bacterium]|nr:ATP-binding protein [Anaerolineae bacterium]